MRDPEIPDDAARERCNCKRAGMQSNMDLREERKCIIL